MDDTQRAHEFVRRFAAAVRARAIYPPTHPIARRSLNAMWRAVDSEFQRAPQFTIGFLGDDVFIGRSRLRTSASAYSLLRQFRDLEVEKISFSRELGPDGLHAFVDLVAAPDPRPLAGRLADAGIRGVTLGVIAPEESAESEDLGAVAARHLYSAAISTAENVWSCARAGEAPDPDAARSIIDTLARAVSDDRSTMMALTALKGHDAYTFTHMVNVAVLTMAQARALGLSGHLVREFGLAGLMHDVGKSRVPLEILNKPAKLTGEEFGIVQRHVIDGAQILRKTPGVPALAPIVAFEHHLRQDLSGYPAGIGHRKLNLCTMLVSIADVFDALRSNRAYREGLPADRVRHMLDELSGTSFEPTLLRRFVTLMGIFPVGTFVRLTTGEIGVVTAEHPSDPFRPRVSIVLDRHEQRLDPPAAMDMSARDGRGAYVCSVAEAVDGAELDLDPLALMGA